LIDISIVNAFQLWSIGKEAPKQLDFREQLMHALVKLLGSNREAAQASRGANACVALAHEHFTALSAEERDCKQCSVRPHSRTRTNYVCSECKVHLCIGKCFAQYHREGH